MNQSQSAEPSMEEILASIRRIIAEDDAPARKPAAEPPLELTQPAADPKSAAAQLDDDLMVFDEPEPEPAAPPPRPAPPPRAAIAPVSSAAMAGDEEGLLSEPAASAALGAFTRLAGSIRVAEAPGQTLEGVVRELLRPMLKEWLDANLPGIVEAKVDAELQRISRASGR